MGYTKAQINELLYKLCFEEDKNLREEYYNNYLNKTKAVIHKEFTKKELIKYLDKHPILHSVQITPQLKYRKYKDLLELYNKTTQYIEKWKEERQAETKIAVS